MKCVCNLNQISNVKILTMKRKLPKDSKLDAETKSDMMTVIVMMVIYDSDDGDDDVAEQSQRAMTCCVVFGILVSAELSTLETGSAVDSKRRKINIDNDDDDNHNHVSMSQLGQISNKFATVVGFETCCWI